MSWLTEIKRLFSTKDLLLIDQTIFSIQDLRITFFLACMMDQQVLHVLARRYRLTYLVKGPQ